MNYYSDFAYHETQVFTVRQTKPYTLDWSYSSRHKNSDRSTDEITLAGRGDFSQADKLRQPDAYG